jgi:hypothetical protein
VKRKKRLSLTVEGGILFGILMLVAAIALIVALLSDPPGPSSERDTGSGKVWAEVLTDADYARLGRLPETGGEP